MTQRADVDVIVLSWNRVAETIAALDSALYQDGPAKRILIVDQGSTPENLTEIRRWARNRPEATLAELGRNVGVTKGRNIASRLGSSPYIVALDNDAEFSDCHVLARTLSRFEAETGLGAIAFRILNYFSGTDDEISWDYPRALRAQSDQEFFVTRFVGAGHALRRDVFERAGEYDESLFFGGEERDLGYRILNLGYRIKYIPSLSVRHKVDPEGRVRWQDGRYYYAVRNTLYSNYKFGYPLVRLMREAGAMTLKGVCNGVGTQAARAVIDACLMSLRYSRSNANDGIYRLSDELKAYIRTCERVAPESPWIRLKRQFERLPGRA